MKMPFKINAKDFLTKKDIKTDMKYLKYYFENMYAGYDLMVEKGFDIDKISDEIYKTSMEKMGAKKKIDRSTVWHTINDVLFREVNKTNIVDMHFSLGGTDSTPQKKLYFSDIYLKAEESPTEEMSSGKTGKKYYVCKIQQDPYPEDIKKNLKILPQADIKIGQEYTGAESNLYECFDGSEKVYRFAVSSNKSPVYANISLDGENIQTPVLPSINIGTTKRQGYVETKDTLYISLSDFVFSAGSSDYEELGKRQFQELCNNAKNLSKNKKHLIIDLRNNGGGQPFRRNAIFANLMYHNTELSLEMIRTIGNIGQENELLMYSPAMASFYRKRFFDEIKNDLKNLEFKDYDSDFVFEVFEDEGIEDFLKSYYTAAFLDLFVPTRQMRKNTSYQGETAPLPEPDFKGDIYILINRNSASCSEYSIALAYEFEKFDGIEVHLIGENTCGAVSFVNPRTIALPKTAYWFYMPTALNLNSEAFRHPNYHGEGKGWYPEYWVTSFQIMSVLQNMIDDPDLAEALKGIERRHL